MVPSESRPVLMYAAPSAGSAAAVVTGQIDTKGFDYLTIDVLDISNTSALALAALELTESDTEMTAATAGTDIVALTGAAATSTSAGFVLPSPSSSCNNLYRFNINLTGRKRFIAIRHGSGVAALNIVHILGTLHRCQSGPAAAASTTAANTALTHQLRVLKSI